MSSRKQRKRQKQQLKKQSRPQPTPPKQPFSGPPEKIFEALAKGGASRDSIVRLQGVISQSQYQSFLPPPEILAAYEKTWPGACDKLHEMARKEQEHRHITIGKVVGAQIWQGKVGLVAAWTIALIGLGGTILLYSFDKGTWGSIVFATVILELAGLFIYQRRKAKKAEGHVAGETSSEQSESSDGNSPPDAE